MISEDFGPVRLLVTESKAELQSCEGQALGLPG